MRCWLATKCGKQVQCCVTSWLAHCWFPFSVPFLFLLIPFLIPILPACKPLLSPCFLCFPCPFSFLKYFHLGSVLLCFLPFTSVCTDFLVVSCLPYHHCCMWCSCSCWPHSGSASWLLLTYDCHSQIPGCPCAQPCTWACGQSNTLPYHCCCLS